MADKKVTQLAALTAPTKEDLLLVIDDPLGSPISKKITIDNFFGATSALTVNAISLIATGDTSLTANNFTLTAANTVTITKGVVINSGGTASDTQIKSDNQENMLYVKASTDRIGIITNNPTSALDINSDSIRIRTANTPASSSVNWQVGTITWDANYIYVTTSAGVTKRASLNTF